MLAFEGNTAAYAMYSYARIASIFRKGAAGSGGATQGEITIAAKQEHALAMALLRFGSVVKQVGETLEPHHLCGYLYEVAGLFATFFQECPVLKAATEEERRSRLSLCDWTARVLHRGLGLLGIDAPDRM